MQQVQFPDIQGLCFLDHKCLLGSYQSKKLANMGRLMPLKLMAGLLIDQLASSTISGAWGVAIVGNFIFPPSRSTPGLPQGAPHHQILPVGCPSMGILFFLPITQLPWPPGRPFPSITSGRMLICGKCSPGYFPFRVPIPAAYNLSIMYLLYTCTYL